MGKIPVENPKAKMNVKFAFGVVWIGLEKPNHSTALHFCYADELTR
jgi:hypothetical protein